MSTIDKHFSTAVDYRVIKKNTVEAHCKLRLVGKNDKIGHKMMIT